MSIPSLSDDPQGNPDLIESTAAALLALVDRREALATDFEVARLLPSGDLRYSMVMTLAEALDACDREISTLLTGATNVVASWATPALWPPLE